MNQGNGGEAGARVDLVMPVYREGANIAAALDELYAKAPLPKRVLVVYDFEEDDTVAVVQSLQEKYPGLVLVRNQFGRGVLNAIRTGINEAKSEIVIITMADLSDDVAIIPRMVELIEREGYDIVCASRYMPGGRQLGGPWLKSFLSRMAGLSLYWLGGLPVRDATNAFRAYRKVIFERFPIDSTGGFEYTLEITAKANAAGYRITELPSTWWDRRAGQSRFRLAAWLPRYLRWYFHALTHRPSKSPSR